MAKATDPLVMSPTEDVLLHKLRYAGRTKIGPAALQTMELGTTMDRVIGNMLVELRAQLYGIKGPERRKQIVHSEPATWWDHLKRDLHGWALEGGYRGLHRTRYALASRLRRGVRWWLRRHPVRFVYKVTTLDFTEQMQFPDNTFVFPEHLGEAVGVQAIRVQQTPALEGGVKPSDLPPPLAGEEDPLGLVARLHELADPIERRAAELADRKDVPIGDQRVGVLALQDDARFLHSLADAIETTWERAVNGHQVIGGLASLVKDR